MSYIEGKYPNAGAYGVSTNHDKTRASLQAIQQEFAKEGIARGFEIASGDITRNAAGQATVVIAKERSAHAVAQGRASGTRWYIRTTITYTTGNPTKVQYEISTDSGSTYSAFVDIEGNSFLNITWAAGLLDSTAWGTS